MQWASKVDFRGRWMPEPGSAYHMFLGEYSWSPAFRHFSQPYYGVEDWTNPGHGCPVDVRRATFEYVAEANGFDCSLDESYTLRLPHYEIIERLGLKWSGRGADYVDQHGNRAAFDPTAHEDGPRGLLIREDVLEEYLSKEGLALCWTILGQKQVYGKGYGREYYSSLTISGAYGYGDRGLNGCLRFCLDEPQTDSPSGEG